MTESGTWVWGEHVTAEEYLRAFNRLIGKIIESSRKEEMTQTTVVADLQARIAELEAELALALAELGNDYAPTCMVGITDAQCAMGFECAKCWKEYLLMKAQEEK